jgi:hypothetical protein
MPLLRHRGGECYVLMDVFVTYAHSENENKQGGVHGVSFVTPKCGVAFRKLAIFFNNYERICLPETVPHDRVMF